MPEASFQLNSSNLHAVALSNYRQTFFSLTSFGLTDNVFEGFQEGAT